MERRRVNISVDAELHGRMRKAAKRYGFGNLCRLTVASVRAVLDAADRRRSLKGRDIPVDPQGDDEYIAAMFEGYAEAENDRKGIRAKTGAHQVE